MTNLSLQVGKLCTTQALHKKTDSASFGAVASQVPDLYPKLTYSVHEFSFWGGNSYFTNHHGKYIVKLD